MLRCQSGIAVIALLLGGALTAAAQTSTPAVPDGPQLAGPGGPPDAAGPPSAPKPASAKLHALTGAWMNTQIVFGVTKPGVAPLQPEYEAVAEKVAKLAAAGQEVPGDEPKCIPAGPIMDMNFGPRVFADGAQMVVITTGGHPRYIWVDGRQHSSDENLFSSYEGESVAHWEGDTLVVDTIGLKETDEIIFGVAINTDKLHMIERWKLISPTMLEIRTTLEDPEVLTKPWSYTRRYAREPLSGEVNYCVLAADRTRSGTLDMTAPPKGYIPPGADK